MTRCSSGRSSEHVNSAAAPIVTILWMLLLLPAHHAELVRGGKWPPPTSDNVFARTAQKQYKQQQQDENNGESRKRIAQQHAWRRRRRDRDRFDWVYDLAEWVGMNPEDAFARVKEPPPQSGNDNDGFADFGGGHATISFPSHSGSRKKGDSAPIEDFDGGHATISLENTGDGDGEDFGTGHAMITYDSISGSRKKSNKSSKHDKPVYHGGFGDTFGAGAITDDYYYDDVPSVGSSSSKGKKGKGSKESSSSGGPPVGDPPADYGYISTAQPATSQVKVKGSKSSSGKGKKAKSSKSSKQKKKKKGSKSSKRAYIIGPDSDDIDGDGVLNNIDNCPTVFNPDQSDIDGDGIGDVCDSDIDGDGVDNAVDNCRFVFNPVQSDIDGDGVGDACDPDIDSDGIPNPIDNCPYVFNEHQADYNSNGIGDTCDPDIDGDGVLNEVDLCPLTELRTPVDVTGCSDMQVDSDLDGYCNPEAVGVGASECVGIDNCPTILNPDQADTDGDGVGDACDLDIDGDGIPNDVDNCPFVINNDQIDSNGNGIGDVCDQDLDEDGVQNEDDLCPDTELGLAVDENGCADEQVDEDGDGYCNPGTPSAGISGCIEADNCPSVFNPDQGDTDGDGVGDACDPDTDGDEIPNEVDNCPFIFNPDQVDSNGNGIGDACDPDLDEDGVPNEDDLCPDTAPDTPVDQFGCSDEQVDADSDGICNPDALGTGASGCTGIDNCPDVINPDQIDTDGNGVGDACDPDIDGDEISNEDDNCPLLFNPDQLDTNGNGIGDACDEDIDGDGVLNKDDLCHDTTLGLPVDANGCADEQVDEDGDGWCSPDAPSAGLSGCMGIDNCPTLPNPDQADLDGDGVGDTCDSDIDGDEIINEEDNCPYVFNPDQVDSNGNGVGDECEPDDDGDGVPNSDDFCPDTPSESEVDEVGCSDSQVDEDLDGWCNSDSMESGPSGCMGVDNCPTVFNPDQLDTNMDGVGDACDTDIDGDEISNKDDNCPLLFNPDQLDSNGNGIGDACDEDIDGDGVPNEMDLCPGTELGLPVDANGCADEQVDEDGDGWCSPDALSARLSGCIGIDNCPTLPNPDQADLDGDGVGDACDSDIDGDEIINEEDNCPYVFNPDQVDSSGNGIGDACTDETPMPTLSPVVMETAAPVTTAPTAAPTAGTFPSLAPSPTLSQAPTLECQKICVEIAPYYISLVAPLADRAPNETEALKMADLVSNYFTSELRRIYSDSSLGVSFNSMTSIPFETRFDAAIPEPRYNLYIDVDSVAIFETDTLNVPTPEELYAILEESMGPSFIVNIVWQAPKTIWISAYQAFLGESTDFRPPEEILDIIPTGGKNSFDATPNDSNIFGIGSARHRILPALPKRTPKWMH